MCNRKTADFFILFLKAGKGLIFSPLALTDYAKRAEASAKLQKEALIPNGISSCKN